jgi:hypothetical protein
VLTQLFTPDFALFFVRSRRFFDVIPGVFREKATMNERKRTKKAV